MVGFGFFLPPSGQLRFGDRLNHVIEQSPDRDAQYGSHSFKHVDCDVFRTALDPANVGPIDISGEGQTLLRKPLLDAQASQIRTDGLPGVHTDAPKHCHGLTCDGLSVPYYSQTWGELGINVIGGNGCKAKYTKAIKIFALATVASFSGVALATGLEGPRSLPMWSHQPNFHPSGTFSTMTVGAHGARTAQLARDVIVPLPTPQPAPAETPAILATDAERELRALSGWWSYEEFDGGCNDTDNQYRAAVGYYSGLNAEEGWIAKFGSGKAQLGFYDTRCDVFDPLFRDGKLELVAMCTGEEGEALNGRATIERLDDRRISLTSPVMTTTLVACSSDQMVTGRGDVSPAASIAEPNPITTPPEAYLRATTLNPQRNALAKVLADYCQPDFFQYNHWGDGKWDAAFYDRYKQQLLVRYLSNCAQMHSSEFLPFTVMDDMLARNPSLFPAGQAALPVGQAQAVGFYLQMRNMADLEQCVFGPKEQVDPQLDQLLAALLSRATQADQFAVAQGYQAADALVGGLPLPAGDGVNCTARPMILPFLTQLAFTSGAFLPRASSN